MRKEKRKRGLYIRQCLASAFNHGAVLCLRTLGCIQLEACWDWTPCPGKWIFEADALLIDYCLGRPDQRSAAGTHWETLRTGSQKKNEQKYREAADDVLQGPMKSTPS